MAKNNKGNRSQGQNQGRGNQGGGNQGGQQQRKGSQSAGGASRGIGNVRGGEQGNFELDNLTYNIITVLHEKSKGLEAYDKYLQDAREEEEVVEIFEEMRADDQRHIQRLEQALRMQLGGGGELGGEEIEIEEEEEDVA